MYSNAEIEKIMPPLPIPRSYKEQSLIAKKEKKKAKKLERKGNHQEEILGPYDLYLVEKNGEWIIYSQLDFPKNKIPDHLKKVAQKI